MADRHFTELVAWLYEYRSHRPGRMLAYEEKKVREAYERDAWRLIEFLNLNVEQVQEEKDNG